ncbi:hypothetical protein ACTXT7_013998 [Hymenolepis weldensis]
MTHKGNKIRQPLCTYLISPVSHSPNCPLSTAALSLLLPFLILLFSPLIRSQLSNIQLYYLDYCYFNFVHVSDAMINVRVWRSGGFVLWVRERIHVCDT